MWLSNKLWEPNYFPHQVSETSHFVTFLSVGEEPCLSASSVAWPPSIMVFSAPTHPPHLPHPPNAWETGPAVEVHWAASDSLPLSNWNPDCPVGG